MRGLGEPVEVHVMLSVSLILIEYGKRLSGIKVVSGATGTSKAGCDRHFLEQITHELSVFRSKNFYLKLLARQLASLEGV